MDRQAADERFERLVATVSEARDLLERVGETHWARWMTTVLGELRRGDSHGLTRLLGAFGGMGSLSDLYLHPANGHQVPQDRISTVNRSLGAMRSAMYTDARELDDDLRRRS